MVFFDLGTKTAEQRKVANKFRNMLLDTGFFRIQLSIYTRSCAREKTDSVIRKIQYCTPSEGHVRLLQVTDKQYANIHLLVGTKKKTEKYSSQQTLLL
jgi:CRISPR-associated protein Cas2